MVLFIVFLCVFLVNICLGFVSVRAFFFETFFCFLVRGLLSLDWLGRADFFICCSSVSWLKSWWVLYSVRK